MRELPAGPEPVTQGQNAPVTVLIVNLEQPSISWDGSLNKVCLGQGDLWACPRGIALIMLIDVGRLHPLWAAPFTRQRISRTVKSRKGAEHK